MSKYINADHLKAEIKRQKHELELSIQSQGDYGQSCHIVAYENIISLIDSLQQEQPEVDLKKEVKEWVELMVGASFPEQDGDFISEEDYRTVIRQTAHHFYELGLMNNDN